jgi:hypothetical protein
VQVSPLAASVEPGATVSFAATISSSGHPAAGVSWSVAGQGCSGQACGTIASDGTYTAPGIAPGPLNVTVTATSVADPTKTATATVQILTTHVLAISPANATVALEQTQSFTATLDGTPTRAVTWSVNGVAGGNTTVGTISNSPSQNGLYLAPVNMPMSRAVTITATSMAYLSLSTSVTVQLTSNIVLSISPSAATRVPGARQTFTASVARTSNPQVEWTVNGVSNGNAMVGEICIAGSNPCTPPPAATQPGSPSPTDILNDNRASAFAPMAICGMSVSSQRM